MKSVEIYDVLFDITTATVFTDYSTVCTVYFTFCTMLMMTTTMTMISGIFSI